MAYDSVTGLTKEMEIDPPGGELVFLRHQWNVTQVHTVNFN